jgi:hypothetical protein
MKFALVCVTTYEDVSYYYNILKDKFNITKVKKFNEFATDEEDQNFIGYNIEIESIEELWKFKQSVFSQGNNHDILIQNSYYNSGCYEIKEPTIRIVDGYLE